MYTTCMFCEKDLGTNQVLESFPVGRRVAFDAARGRLWVVCRSCERWNLSPLEERWEAVEDAERLFRETRLRASTENIGLARHREGLELVRIGDPVRGEFAAWRYGDQFGRRRKKAILYGVGGGVAVAALAIGGIATGVLSSVAVSQFGNVANLLVNARTRVTLKDPEGNLLKLKQPDLMKTRLRAGVDGRLEVSLKKGGRVSVFQGPDAERAAGLILPKLNSTGGARRTVRDAVARIEEAGHPERFVRAVAEKARTGRFNSLNGKLSNMDKPTKLALEMALHEERERQALEGELRGLEAIWRREEEIAGIADSLLLPDGAEERIASMKERREAASG
jgi:hypothetical protein